MTKPHGLRVIAGSLKGRRLKAPGWKGLRPTSDKLRETLFNVLAGRMAGARVLDAFAGTGAIGLEALSRGAAEVTFIDSDPRARALIAQNLAHCGVTEGYTILGADFRAAFERFSATSTFVPFDIVFLDPPYNQSDDVLAPAASVVAGTGVVVLEHSRRRPSPAVAGALVRVRELHSGESTLSFYERV
jgi:16S rRNA (guanine(966)-N(2))-methyltransferase RsmD